MPTFDYLAVLPPGADSELSLSAELSVLQAMEPVGEPDEAWQRLYQRITQQRTTSGLPGGYSSEVNFVRSVLQPCARSPGGDCADFVYTLSASPVTCSPGIMSPIR